MYTPEEYAEAIETVKELARNETDTEYIACLQRLQRHIERCKERSERNEHLEA